MTREIYPPVGKIRALIREGKIQNTLDHVVGDLEW